MVHRSRVQPLNEQPVYEEGSYILYWMQASQRAHVNPALEYAAARANASALPLVVCFGLTDGYPEANERHYAFMLEGLADVAAALRKRGVRFVAKRGDPPDVALHYARRAAVVVCDRGYLRHQRRWRDAVADGAGRQVVQVEGDVVVPVEVASDKDEFAARTIRPRISRHLERYLVGLPTVRLRRTSRDPDVGGDIDVTDVTAALAKLKIDRSVGRVNRFAGGTTAARKLLAGFIRDKLPGYSERRNEPAAAGTSTMAAYLHFGQVSPVEIALAVRSAAHAPAADREAYLEELIVRRELSVNHVYYNPRYDTYDGLPDWAKKTLAAHEPDERYHVYTRATGAGRDARPVVERGPAGDGRHRVHAQLHAHVLGQKDSWDL